MKKYILIYHNKISTKQPSPEEMKKGMDVWMAWFGSFQKQMVDGGNPFAPLAKSVTAKGVETVSADKWPATGYTIINAESMDEATKIAKTCPVLTNQEEGSVRIYEALPM